MFYKYTQEQTLHETNYVEKATNSHMVRIVTLSYLSLKGEFWGME